MNNSAQAKLRGRGPGGGDTVRDLSLGERSSRRPAAGVGTSRSSSCINCGLIEFPKRVCSEVHATVKGISSLSITWFLRLNRANCGDAAIALAISWLQYAVGRSSKQDREREERFLKVWRGGNM